MSDAPPAPPAPDVPAAPGRPTAPPGPAPVDPGVELLSDAPVARVADDLLGRLPVAVRLCELACALPLAARRVWWGWWAAPAPARARSSTSRRRSWWSAATSRW
ncbi:MAG: hypothetical protein HS111_07240 [Kofleriaceae bacterium]|nr:hypothetical protein [Kofleriaceae bacterium]